MRAGVGERQRFHLFEAGAFVTRAYRHLVGGADHGRFHLFEAGAFVTFQPVRPGSTLRGVSTYLKLELLSLVGQALTSRAREPRFHLFKLELLSHRMTLAESGRQRGVSTYLKLELLSRSAADPRVLTLKCAFPPI